MRIESLRSLDLEDYHDREPALDLNHRPETDMALKNKSVGERLVALGEEEARVIDDDIEHKRENVTDEHGRSPLITTQNGRVGKVTIRRTI